jgi:hypothetical protein
MEKRADEQQGFEFMQEEETALNFMMGFTCVEQYFQCSLCGGSLYFSHHTDFTKNITMETSKCVDCEGKTKNILHRLQ